ncbi:type I inositol polyphosphate 5-phosphatase 5 [Rhodamnia argentea]|uniref:Type I inositol polyphosphate 5-phosphatase 5 n=1 Tax=Rhodamnia argentea TaxID=178133 RepID=A0A8B8PK26_9MYRT|nr:type I inositol polyphosphate 5-phosphatase 5 [Rhodamnia argentea]
MSKIRAFMEASSPPMRKSFSERQTNTRIEGLNLSSFEVSMAPETEARELRIFVGTWNVGGRTPNNTLNLEDFLQVEGSSDLYVLGFQEIVPLSAGNVLVVEDNEPAAKWLVLINQALNRPYHNSDSSGHGPKRSNNSSRDSAMRTTPNAVNFLQKPSLKVLRKSLKANKALLKSCNCSIELSPIVRERRRQSKLSDTMDRPEFMSFQYRRESCTDDLFQGAELDPHYSPSSPVQSVYDMKYKLVTCKQMVGIFLTVWARSELVQHVGHLRVSSVGRGIMGCFGNKGCISISLSLHQTSFCFVCSHLASGEKEGDELRRNADVCEILKSTQFPKICKKPDRRDPERIRDHDRVIWMGDLNYRVSLSYEETRSLLEGNDWNTLLEKDQLNIEREAGRVFNGFKEGRILFAPTYKYSHNSDSYAGETVKSKKKRRTPAWCDRILWSGNGIEQLSYIRGESAFSDHRPVCSVFAVVVEVARSRPIARFRKGISCAGSRVVDYGECIPQRHSLNEF